MAKILLDVGGFHSLHDFRTGESAMLPDALCRDLTRITSSLAYPGDLCEDSIPWTTDAALQLCDYYAPDFLFVSYATPYLMKLNLELTEEDGHALDALVIAQVERLLSAYDYQPIIVCAGGMRPLAGVVSLDDMEGYVSSSVRGVHYNGVFDATPADWERARALPHVADCISREQLQTAFPDMCDYCAQHLPDFLLTSEDGYAFNEFGSRGFTMRQLPVLRTAFQIHAAQKNLRHILDIRPAIDTALNEGKKVALILLEGVDGAALPLPTQSIDISLYGTLTYEQATSYYAAILTGQPFWRPGMPPLVYNVAKLDRTDTLYPLSHVTDHTLLPGVGLHPGIRSAAAGTRSMLTHCFSMCDIAVECHSRSLTESGVCMFLNDRFCDGE